LSRGEPGGQTRPGSPSAATRRRGGTGRAGHSRQRAGRCPRGWLWAGRNGGTRRQRAPGGGVALMAKSRTARMKRLLRSRTVNGWTRMPSPVRNQPLKSIVQTSLGTCAVRRSVAAAAARDVGGAGGAEPVSSGAASGEGACHRQMHAGMQVAQTGAQFTRSPSRMAAADLAQGLLPTRGQLPWRAMRPAGTILQTGAPVVAEALQPFVARGGG